MLDHNHFSLMSTSKHALIFSMFILKVMGLFFLNACLPQIKPPSQTYNILIYLEPKREISSQN